MSKLYQENKKIFAMGYLIHLAYETSFTALANYVPASRKVISKVFSDHDMADEMVGMLENGDTVTPPIAFIEKILPEGEDVPASYEDLMEKAGLCLIDNAKPPKKVSVAINKSNKKKDKEEEADNSISYVGTKSSIVVTKGNETRTVKKGSSTFIAVKEAILGDDLEKAWELASPKEMILKVTKGDVEIENGKLKFKGVSVSNGMATRIMALLNRDGMKYAEHLAAFADKCMTNPSFRAVNELFRFMEKNTLPICPDGDFLAYKKIRSDYLDIHSGTVLNKPHSVLSTKEIDSMPIHVDKGNVTVSIENGETVVAMPRNNVNDNYEETCSNGLHVCGHSYLEKFGTSPGNLVVICKINPRDVVAVPKDYGDQKMRCCRYTVLKTIDIKGNNQLKDFFISDMKAV